MSHRFRSVICQALKTFDLQEKSGFHSNFEILKQLTNGLTFQDVGVNEELFNAVSASFGFMDILETDKVSMGVFVLRSGCTLPLHDHPLMHGLLRCIYGKLHLQSYSQVTHSNRTPIYDPLQEEIDVITNELLVIDAMSECSTLSPRENNFHQITAVGSVSAFFDILGPPYEADMPVYGIRECSYYTPQAISPEGSVIKLARKSTPSYYFCEPIETPTIVRQLVADAVREQVEHNL